MERKPLTSAKRFKGPDGLNWISSSFDAATSATEKPEFKLPSNTAKKRTAYSSKKKKSASKSNSDDVCWPEVFAPQTKEDLAVHKKKICEVEEWLLSTLKSCTSVSSKRQPLFLLLTGPAGSGKTATVKVLAKQMNASISEWSSSVYETVSSTIFTDANNRNKFSSLDGAPQTQASIFRDFFLRANKYQPLFSTETGRIVLIEEFPNAFVKEPAQFHSILRAFHRVGKCPVVFIISDCSAGDSYENLLFPKEVQVEFRIKHISFNPIAPTMLSRALNSICSAVSQSLPKSVVEGIAADCMGDIRSAINALHFFCTSKNSSKAKSSTSSSKQSGKSSNNTARDTPLFLFHALGKILYCKRDSTKESDSSMMPPHMSHMARCPLISNPEEVFEKTSISADGFGLFLHENYLSFVDDVEVAAFCSAAFAESDALCTEWKVRTALNEYAASIVNRGLMFNLRPIAGGNRWCPLRKPQYFSSVKNYRNSCVALRRTFPETRLNSKELQIELLPYLSKIGYGWKNPEQAQAVKQFGQMAVKKIIRPCSESLSSNDVVNDSGILEESFPEVNEEASNPVDCYEASSEEEIVIEEYDSE